MGGPEGEKVKKIRNLVSVVTAQAVLCQASLLRNTASSRQFLGGKWGKFSRKLAKQCTQGEHRISQKCQRATHRGLGTVNSVSSQEKANCSGTETLTPLTPWPHS